MNYIFSNVYKFAEEKDFVKSLENVGLQDGDTMIFLNQAIPLDHASVFFRRFNIISLHRIHIAPSGEIKWFGEEEMLKRMDEYSKDQSSSIVRIKMFYLDNAGVVKDKSGNVVWQISVNNYPDGKMPTTGFYAYKFALQCLKGGVTLVNFYGSLDNSTSKWGGHDWSYEEYVLKNVSPKLLISDSGWRMSSVNIKSDTSELEMVKQARDKALADLASVRAARDRAVESCKMLQTSKEKCFQELEKVKQARDKALADLASVRAARDRAVESCKMLQASKEKSFQELEKAKQTRDKALADLASVRAARDRAVESCKMLQTSKEKSFQELEKAKQTRDKALADLASVRTARDRAVESCKYLIAFKNKAIGNIETLKQDRIRLHSTNVKLYNLVQSIESVVLQ